MNGKRHSVWQWGFPMALILLWPPAAFAHPAMGLSGGFGGGFAHPLAGLDHLCAMFGVGLWSAQQQGRARWLMPLVFLGVMAAGGGLGLAEIRLPYVEAAILSSLLIVGIAVALAIRPPLAVSVALAGAFALFHGHAHGTEFSGADPVAYGAGFLAGTALLLACSAGLGLLVRGSRADRLVPYAGAAIALCGVYLCLG